MNAFRLRGVVRQMDVDACLDFQLLLQWARPSVWPGFGPRFAHAAVITVPAQFGEMLRGVSEQDAIEVRGRIEGLYADGDAERERLSGIGSSLPAPAYGFITRMVAERITKLDLPASRFEYTLVPAA